MRPEDRYPSSEEFVVALRGALGVRPTEERASVAAGGRPTRRIVAGTAAVVVVAVVAVALASFGFGRGAGPSPSPVPASPEGSAVSASAAPSATASGATSDVFPNAEEQGLLALLAAVPGGFSKTCVRGSYAAVPVDVSVTYYSVAPLASLVCSRDIATGTSQVVVRQFRPDKAFPFVENFMLFLARRRIGNTATAVIPPGDCATESPAIGPWGTRGEARGTLACYTDEATGDALLYWSYDGDALLVRARNPKGDSAALYSFFDKYAKFIAP